jgi:hypothetical protein
LRLTISEQEDQRRTRATDELGREWHLAEEGRWVLAEPLIPPESAVNRSSDNPSRVQKVPTKLDKRRRATRRQEPVSDIADRPYSAISMFSGCGGLDLGAIAAGVKVRWANDSDRPAVETYRNNIGDHIVQGDVRQLEPPREACDLLIAGPPCQDFSTLWTHEGALTPRGNLYREVARFLAALALDLLRSFSPLSSH